VTTRIYRNPRLARAGNKLVEAKATQPGFLSRLLARLLSVCAILRLRL